MSATETALPGLPPEPGPDKGIVAAGWLGSQSIFDRPDERKIWKAMATSFAIHLGILVAVFFILLKAPAVVQQSVPMVYNVFFKPDPGPGGGGGGSPAPAPKKQIEVPKTKAPEQAPVVVPPPPVEPPPTPTLNAPILTNSPIIQASGVSAISNAQYGGGGRGAALAPGRAMVSARGRAAGSAAAPSGPAPASIIRIRFERRSPKYTSEAMRAKIQGQVELEAVVLPNGTIGEVRIVKSLDKQYGLDQEAIAAAKQWLFRPGTDKDGRPIPVIVTLVLEFRLH